MKILKSLALAALFFEVAPYIMGAEIPRYIPNQVLVRYKTGRSADARASISSAYGVNAKTKLAAIETDRLSVPAGTSVESFMETLRKNPDVEFVEQNAIYRAFDNPNDPQFQNHAQYYLSSTTATGSINVVPAWAITTGNANVVVAVCDTGILLTHADLQNQLWTNPSPSGNSGLHGTTIEIDWDNNGDCTGTDATAGADQCASGDPTDNEAPAYHGTHVSGLIAAETNNGTDIAGIARSCKLMGIKVLNSSGFGSAESIAAGIIFAADHGASVINLSLGSDTNSGTISAAVDYAIRKNVVVVAAAGNSAGRVNFPAALNKVIAVGATDSNDQLTVFTCTGPEVDLVAPGLNILSTTLGGTSLLSGTSFSSPIVAAVVALMRSVNTTMSVEDITRALDFTTTDLGATGFDNNFGFGKVNAYAAVVAAQNATKFTSNPGFADKSFPFPNPFNPNQSAKVIIALPASLGTEGIKIDIRTVSGVTVKTLNGTNEWDGKNDDGNVVASGLYFYFAKTSKGDVKGKLTVIK